MKNLLLLSTKPMENICTVIIQKQNYVRDIFTKIRDSKSLTLNVSLKMRSCIEIDINILFVFNTKCIHPRGHFIWMLHPAKHQELISKVLAKFSFFTNFRRIHISRHCSFFRQFYCRGWQCLPWIVCFMTSTQIHTQNQWNIIKYFLESRKYVAITTLSFLIPP